jgi:tRNA wybutosine-synthesizing protein 3
VFVAFQASCLELNVAQQILHILTASLDHAQLVLKCGLQAGFRESGAVNVVSAREDEPVTPMVAIRSMGLGLESLVGVQKEHEIKQTVSDDYLHALLDISNDRFGENRRRIERFRGALMQLTATAAQSQKKKDGTEWEDANTRRERKKAEGMRRKAHLDQARKSREAEGDGPVNVDDGLDLGFEAQVS